MNNSNGHTNQTVMEPTTRIKRGGTSANLSKAGGPNHSRRWRLVVITGILIAGAVAIYLHFDSGKKQPARGGGIPPLPISTATVRTGDIGVYVNALGTVTPFNTVSLTARVAGQIAKVEYEEGQLVHVGDPLVEIDPAPFPGRRDLKPRGN
jgi:multidrug efflux system membrane fusion protein